MQIWYTREGEAHIGTASIYTVGKFDGLVLVVDMYGGKVNQIIASSVSMPKIIMLRWTLRAEVYEAS